MNKHINPIIGKLVSEARELVNDLSCLVVEELDADDLVKDIQGQTDSAKKSLELQQGLEWQLDEILHTLSTSVLGPMIEVMGLDTDDLDGLSDRAKSEIADSIEIKGAEDEQ